MKKFLLTISLCFAFAPLFAHAQTASDLTLTPVVIDEKGAAQDIDNESVTLTNNTSHVLDLFPQVNNINDQSGQQTFAPAQNSGDLSASLANWIEFGRGVIELQPGETRSIPFVIRVNLNAVAGDYHASVSFYEGNTLAEAQAKPAVGAVTVNFEVQADIKQILQLDSFSTGNVFFSGDNILFNYNLENIGNQALQPQGEIRIYDRKGEEVASVSVNQDSKSITPSQVSQMASVWTAASGFGQYKALLTVRYGQTASVTDTVFFWIIPWKQLLIMSIITLVALVGLSLYFHRWLEQRHLYKLAHAGMLHPKAMEQLDVPYHAPKPAPQPRSAFAVVSRPSQSTPAPAATHAAASARASAHIFAHSAPQPAPLASSKIERRGTLKERLAKESHPAHGAAIDLKKLQLQREHTAAFVTTPQARSAHHVEVRGHVISLKKNS